MGSEGPLREHNQRVQVRSHSIRDSLLLLPLVLVLVLVVVVVVVLLLLLLLLFPLPLPLLLLLLLLLLLVSVHNHHVGYSATIGCQFRMDECLNVVQYSPSSSSFSSSSDMRMT